MEHLSLEIFFVTKDDGALNFCFKHPSFGKNDCSVKFSVVVVLIFGKFVVHDKQWPLTCPYLHFSIIFAECSKKYGDKKSGSSTN